MTLVSTLGNLLRLGISARLDGDQMRLSGPKGVLSEGVQEAVKRHRAEIVALLKRPDTLAKPGASDAGDDIRQQLANDLADSDNIDELMAQFDRRRLVSLAAQYPHPSARLSDKDAAAMAATEIRITYVRGLS